MTQGGYFTTGVFGIFTQASTRNIEVRDTFKVAIQVCGVGHVEGKGQSRGTERVVGISKSLGLGGEKTRRDSSNWSVVYICTTVAECGLVNCPRKKKKWLPTSESALPSVAELYPWIPLAAQQPA